MELLIYKASAGSGKTFTLAVEYIRHLIANPKAYRGILAVTFTNKATAEMKQRILQQLWGIWQADKEADGYLAAVSQRLAEAGHLFTEAQIRSRAGEALQNILHDYNRFQVSTIDSFFQIVIRNLAKELSIGSNLNIEIDQKPVIDEAVDNFIASLSEGSPHFGWIAQYVNSLLDDDRNWKFDTQLKKFAMHIFNESFMERGEELRQQLEENANAISDYKKELDALKAQAWNGLKALKTKFDGLMQMHGVGPEDMGQSAAKQLVKYLKAIDEDNYEGNTILNKTMQGLLEDEGKWTTKTAKNRNEICSLAQSVLIPALQNIEKARIQAKETKISCRLSVQFLYQLQLINAIAQEVKAENHEKNRFLLSDTNHLLSRLIGESDASFIFEKIGANISTIMIDEFQDTSRMQWKNFKPLLTEGLSKGGDSLIVGDVKQSIYRWRNGDWNILNNMHEQDHPHAVRIKSLQTNYRSQKNIIDFNNALFKNIVQNLNSQYQSETGCDCTQLLGAYADVEQKPRTNRNEGYVKTVFLQKEQGDDFDTSLIYALAEEVAQLMSKGIRPGQIAILVRSKKRILAPLAEHFSNVLNLKIVSDEAFRLDSSAAVGIIVGAMRLLSDPTDKVAAAALAMDWKANMNMDFDATAYDIGLRADQLLRADTASWLPQDFADHLSELAQMPLYDLAEKIYELFNLDALDGQDAYLFKFFDVLADFIMHKPSDIQSFLQAWDESLHETSIPGNEIDGIRICTIHSAKGLEFDTVIIPHCDWALEKENSIELQLWTHPTQEPYNRLSLVPVAYGSSMLNSCYAADYLQERLQLWVDSLNTLYVAFTRAARNLIVFSKSSQRGGALTIASVLKEAMPEVTEQLNGATWDEENLIFEYGTLCSLPERACQGTSTNPMAFIASKCPIYIRRSTPHIEFKESNRSADFIAGTAEEDSPHRFMDRGKLLHALFASIGTMADVDKAIGNMVQEGLIGGCISEEEVRAEVKRAFALPAVQQWYDGSWQLFNERDIIWTDEDGTLQTRRPDRVMYKDGQMVVVDFKFGKPKKQHTAQVREYMELLAKMGYGNITGYIWYVDEEKTVKA